MSPMRGLGFHYLVQSQWTALHWACHKGNIDMAVALLQAGASMAVTTNVRLLCAVCVSWRFVLLACHPSDGPHAVLPAVSHRKDSRRLI